MNKDMKNIVLIGMPSCGKSTAGVLLAKRIGFGFLDCDLIIQREENALLSEIIAKKGAEGYLEIENRVSGGVSCENCVVATGGSVCYCEEAMGRLKELGTVVYLRIGAAEMQRRIPNLEKRGVVMRSGIETLGALYRERVPLYEKYADVTVDCSGLSVEETSEAVMRALGLAV